MPYYDFPYDPTANAVSNLITDEIHTIDMNADISVFPDHGPFFDEMNGLVVEGRTGTGPWEEFRPNIDFNFSPGFLQAMAKTGKQVFTFITLIKSCNQVRLKYQCLGKYEDKDLLAVIATSNIDRSSDVEWSTIWGPSEYYNPRLRDPSLHDKTSIEVFNEAIQKLLVSISNPMSSSVITTADVTKLQQQIEGMATADQVKGYHLLPSSEPIELASDSPDVILTFGPDVTNASFVVVFKANDGRSQMIHVLVVRNGQVPDQTIYGEVVSEDDMLKIETSVQADQLVVSLTAETSGLAKTKIIFAC